MGYIALAGAVIQGGIAIYNASQSPNYPNPPKLQGINVPKVAAEALATQQAGYNLSDQRFAQRYPLLAAGKTAEINQISSAQHGGVSPLVSQTLSNTGLEQVPKGNEYQTAQQLGVPIQSKAAIDRVNLNRIISENPERTGPLTGTQIATLMANNYKNANSFNQQLYGINMNQYAGAVQQNVANLNAIGPAISGVAQAGAQYAINQENPLSLGSYQAGASYGYVPAYTNPYSSGSADSGNPYYTG